MGGKNAKEITITDQRRNKCFQEHTLNLKCRKKLGKSYFKTYCIGIGKLA